MCRRQLPKHITAGWGRPNDRLGAIWIRACGRHEGWKPGKNDRICGKHFAGSDYVINPTIAKSLKFKPGQARLNPGVVPTLFTRPAGTQGVPGPPRTDTAAVSRRQKLAGKRLKRQINTAPSISRLANYRMEKKHYYCIMLI